MDVISKFRTTLIYPFIIGLFGYFIGGAASAQDKPNSTVSAATASDVVVNSPTTKDGRLFSNLTDRERRELSRPEKERYYAWKEAEVDKEIEAERIRGKQLDAKTKQLDAKSEQLDAKSEQLDAKSEQLDNNIAALQRELGIKASQSIQPLLADYQDGKTPAVSQELRDVIIQIANGELPPANMRSQAQELVKYFK